MESLACVALTCLALAGAPAVSPIPLVAPDEMRVSPAPLVRALPDLPAEEAAPYRASIGLSVSAGVPSGVQAGLAYRPVPWGRAELGGSYNGAAAGVVTNLTFGWLTFPFTPTLTLSAGHFATGDASGLAHAVGVHPGGAAVAYDIGYDFGAAELGIEMGWPNHFVFQLRGGMSYLHAALGNTQAALRATSGDAGLSAVNAEMNAWVPSATLGFMIYLL